MRSRTSGLDTACEDGGARPLHEDIPFDELVSVLRPEFEAFIKGVGEQRSFSLSAYSEGLITDFVQQRAVTVLVGCKHFRAPLSPRRMPLRVTLVAFRLLLIYTCSDYSSPVAVCFPVSVKLVPPNSSILRLLDDRSVYYWPNRSSLWYAKHLPRNCLEWSWPPVQMYLTFVSFKNSTDHQSTGT